MRIRSFYSGVAVMTAARPIVAIGRSGIEQIPAINRAIFKPERDLPRTGSRLSPNSSN
jgi:hypothetical protein